jgi:hypothetical protein
MAEITKMIEFTLATEKKISRMCVKMAEFALAKWMSSSKIVDALLKWLREP